MNNSNNNVRDYPDLQFITQLNLTQIVKRHENLIDTYTRLIKRLAVNGEIAINDRYTIIERTNTQYELILLQIQEDLEKGLESPVLNFRKEAKKRAIRERASANRWKNSTIKRLNREIATIQKNI